MNEKLKAVLNAGRESVPLIAGVVIGTLVLYSFAVDPLTREGLVADGAFGVFGVTVVPLVMVLLDRLIFHYARPHVGTTADKVTAQRRRVVMIALGMAAFAWIVG